MDDNILISHELTHIINTQKAGNRYLAALKLDMNKAYDTVSWVFILKILTAYGFPSAWVRLIQQCIETVSYRVLVNGSITVTFQPHCGLRKGDPLSPYLFLLCMDILSRMTTLRTDIRQLQGIKIGKQGPTISHLFFADDAHFFSRASESACNTINSMVTRFYNISGQMINRQKSFVNSVLIYHMNNVRCINKDSFISLVCWFKKILIFVPDVVSIGLFQLPQHLL